MSLATTAVAAIEKVELHCHLDGILDPAMLASLRAEGHDLGLDPEILARRYPFDSLEKWERSYYQLLDPFLSPAEERLTLILEQHIRRLRGQRVTYAEIFVSRLLFARDDVGELVEVYRRLRERASAAAGGDLEIELVVAVGRGKPSKLEAQSPRIMALHRAGLIGGVALAGDEARCAVAPLRSFFEAFRAAGLGIEIHAGESMPAASVWDALDNGSPHRIGHGISAFADPQLIDTLRERGIHVEFCPTSNLRLGAIRTIAELPIVPAMQAGIEFSINTDDPGPFECSLSSELELVGEAFGLDELQLREIGEAARRAGFRQYRR